MKDKAVVQGSAVGEQTKRKRGRPPGSKNKPKQEVVGTVESPVAATAN